MMGRLIQTLLGLDAPLDSAWALRVLLSEPFLPATAVAAAALIASLYYWLLYRRDGRRLSRRRGRLLTGLRLAVAGVVLAMILRPALSIVHQEVRLPVVAVLVDESTSMALPAERNNPLLPPAGGSVRADRSRYAVAAQAAARLADPLTRTHRLALYTFSDRLERVKDLPWRGEPSIPPARVEEVRSALKSPTGEHTNIAEAVTAVLDDLAGSKVSGVVVLSDGRMTDGNDLSPAVEAARRRGVALHTVTCGTEDPPRDLGIAHLIAPPEASLNDVMALRVTVVNHVQPHLAVEMRILEEGRLLAAQPLTLEMGRNDRTIAVVPRTPGERKFRLELPELPEELTYDNNHAEFTVTVVQRELRALFVAGAPSLEYHFIVQSLSRDPIINVSCWLQSADINYIHPGRTGIDRLPRTLKEWQEYHVVVLYDVDPKELTNEQETALEAMVRDGGGLLLVAGRTHGMDKLLQVRGARMRALLPVEIDKDRPPDYERVHDRPFRAQRTEAGRKHPIFRFEMSDKANDDVWASLPEFHWHHPVVGVKPSAVTLLERLGEGGADGAVLMALQRYEKGVVFYSGLQTLWRWRYPYENYDYDRFWGQLVRYLAETRLLGTQKQVALYTDKEAYPPGQGVQVSLAVLDPALANQLRAETILATIVAEGGAEFRLPMRPVTAEGLSEYRATYTAKRVGNYRVNVRHALARGSSDQRPLFDEARAFRVELQSLELADPTADPATMRKLAARTGGRALAGRGLADLASLAGQIPTDRQLVPRQAVEDFWDSPLLLVVFLAFICAEWVLRKRWELL